MLNKHMLAAGGYSESLDINSSDIKLYGDIFIVCTRENKLIDFQISEYGEFYTNINMYDNYDEFSDSSDEEQDDNIEKNDNYIKNLNNSNIIKKNNKGITILRKDTMIYE